MKRREYCRGVLYEVIPLTVLGVVSAVMLVLVTLLRRLICATAFLVYQQTALIILGCGMMLGCGLVLSLFIFTLVIVSTLRRVAMWRHDGYIERAQAAPWTLSASALVLLLSVVLALVLPQYLVL